MRRRWFVLQGAVLIAGGLLLTWLFGPATLADPANAFQTGALVLSGVLFAVGGFGASLGDVRWYRFVGAGDVLLGASLAVNLPVRAALAGTASAEDLFFGAATALGGLALAVIGADWFRGGKHFDLSAFE